MAGTIAASVIKNDTTSPPAFQNSAGTEIGRLCRAWAKFNGTAATITSAFNVSSVVRNSTGNYTVNFTNAMPDANYAMNATSEVWIGSAASGNTVSACAVAVFTGAGAVTDSTGVSVAIFR